jgi:hypothetical protein
MSQWSLSREVRIACENLPADAFETNAIDMQLLSQVDDQILKDIAVSAAGHRMRIRNAIAKLAPAPIAEVNLSATTRRHETTAASAERRQLTVIFCDLVGSTAPSRRALAASAPRAISTRCSVQPRWSTTRCSALQRPDTISSIHLKPFGDNREVAVSPRMVRRRIAVVENRQIPPARATLVTPSGG